MMLHGAVTIRTCGTKTNTTEATLNSNQARTCQKTNYKPETNVQFNSTSYSSVSKLNLSPLFLLHVQLKPHASRFNGWWIRQQKSKKLSTNVQSTFDVQSTNDTTTIKISNTPKGSKHFHIFSTPLYNVQKLKSYSLQVLGSQTFSLTVINYYNLF